MVSTIQKRVIRLPRNGVIIAQSIKQFDVKGNNKMWIIEIKSSNQEGKEYTEKTEIYLRNEDD